MFCRLGPDLDSAAASDLDLDDLTDLKQATGGRDSDLNPRTVFLRIRLRGELRDFEDT